MINFYLINKLMRKHNLIAGLAIIISLLLFVSSCKDNETFVSYKVTIISNGGTNIAPIMVNAGELLPKNKLYPNPIVNDGGQFISWCTDPNLQNEFDFTTPITKNMTLYAKWFYSTFNISFEMNGAEPKDSVKVIQGKCFAIPDKPTLNGSVFIGWYEDAEFSNPFNFNLPILTDKKLYARWENQSPSSWFTIDGNGLLTSCTPPDGTKVVIIPSNVKAIPAWFVLANGLNEPGKPGFATGKNIKEFILPDSLETIGEGAFKFAGITAINIPAKITALESVVFEGCSSLKSLTFAQNSKLLRLKSNDGNNTVIGAAALESVSFPPSLTYVGKYTMKGCNSLKTVTFERSASPVIFDTFLAGGGVWLFNGYFPTQIKMPNNVKASFLTEMRKVMQDYEYGKMSAIVEGY